MTTHHPRQHPVILLTGTPGTGKSTHASLLCSSSPSHSPLKHLNIGDIVKDQGLHEGWDEEWGCWIVDEDRLLDYLETVINPENGPADTGFILDHHAPSLFPERWVDLAVVLQTDNEVLYERLESRKYPQSKILENTTAEIMQVILSETLESYSSEIVVELTSDGLVEGELEENVGRIERWVVEWKKNGGGKGHDGMDEDADAEGEDDDTETETETEGEGKDRRVRRS